MEIRKLTAIFAFGICIVAISSCQPFLYPFVCCSLLTTMQKYLIYSEWQEISLNILSGNICCKTC
nr:MAG TPA: hypothetical protein [Bacteriophage sp.]